MPSSSLRAAVLVLLALSFIDQNEALTPFQLTYVPAHVVRHMTKQVSIRCAHEDDSQVSSLQDISRIRLLKKTSDLSGWQLLAELRDNEDKPKAFINVSVTANIDEDIRQNFIQIVWPVATGETYGIYRCDVIGFDRNTFLNKAEVTSEVSLLEENVTTTDMLDMFLETKDEMHHIEDDTHHLEDDIQLLNYRVGNITQQVQDQGDKLSQLDGNVDTVSKSLNLVSDDVSVLKRDVGTIKSEMDSVDENARKIDLLNRDLESARRDMTSLGSPTGTPPTSGRLSLLMSWPTGRFALLQPKTGCPVDLTFFGGNNKYWQIHTESSVSGSRNAVSDILSPKTLSKNNGNNFLTLKFCEANGVLNTAAWPSGSYCINRVYGVPCPYGFNEGEVSMDLEDTNYISEYTARSVHRNGQKMAFCCMSSGYASTVITLPTHSPFILYRRAGRCQEISRMAVTQETIIVDTENSGNQDSKSGTYPDLDLTGGSTIKMYLCHYTKI
ncbi:MACPF domain-containing protein 2 [Elysia marginata]|uniref:MACPF domain-containing protein 2 n=1 Tax=Elysia marginata TaxID=1093978 RepID=A0AAV4JXQ6_9GAST|nr:MACPF domain-containing protein 2 [Elysia marginata]